MIDFQVILHKVYSEIGNRQERGKVATYIPELGDIDINKFGIHLVDSAKNEYSEGHSQEKFSIQSISKVLSLTMALSLVGEKLWSRVDVEPSGDPFNHLSLLEQENGIPRNPLINAGAIVVADVLVSELKNAKVEFLDFIRRIANDPSIDYNLAVAKSEKNTGFRNFAAANLLKSYGNLKNNVDEVLDFYFHQCSLEMNCAQLAETFFLFSNKSRTQPPTT